MPQLQLDVTADATAAQGALEGVGDAARGMATDVSAAASSADSAAGNLDGLAASSDTVASNAGKMTGAFGALAGGLEAAGFPGAAAGLQGVAVATDVASGAGDLFNLVLESQAVQFVIQKARMAASVVATTAQTAVTGVATAAQWAWNAALTANPIGLVIAGVALLVGGLILAYNKVGPFRDAVDAAMDLARDGIGFVVDALESLVGWVKDAADPWSLIKDAIDLYLTPGRLVIEGVSAALEAAVGWVQDLVGWIGRIDFPSPPDWLGDVIPGRMATDGINSSDPRLLPASPWAGWNVIKLEVPLGSDRDKEAETMANALRDYYARQGKQLQLVQR